MFEGLVRPLPKPGEKFKITITKDDLKGLPYVWTNGYGCVGARMLNRTFGQLSDFDNYWSISHGTLSNGAHVRSNDMSYAMNDGGLLEGKEITFIRDVF